MQPSTPSDDDLQVSLSSHADPAETVQGAVRADEVIPIVEETLRVETRQTVTGKVRVSTLTETKEEIARADLKSEAVEVTRVPVDRIIDEAPSVRTEGDVTIVPILEEILVVEKKLVLKEELHIRRRFESETFEVPVELRKQRAVVERLNPDDNTHIKDEETS